LTTQLPGRIPVERCSRGVERGCEACQGSSSRPGPTAFSLCALSLGEQDAVLGRTAGVAWRCITGSGQGARKQQVRARDQAGRCQTQQDGSRGDTRDVPGPSVSDVHCLYRFYNVAGRLLYVGLTGNPGNRIGQHRRGKTWWCEVARMEVEHCASRSALVEAETRAIERERPLYNVQGLKVRASKTAPAKRRGPSAEPRPRRRRPHAFDECCCGWRGSGGAEIRLSRGSSSRSSSLGDTFIAERSVGRNAQRLRRV
jgi:predicted GIY-YIG superfamily endonuclease